MLFYFNLVTTQIESDEDGMWNADVRESDEELAARGMKFMNWYATIRLDHYIGQLRNHNMFFRNEPQTIVGSDYPAHIKPFYSPLHFNIVEPVFGRIYFQLSPYKTLLKIG